MIKSNIYNQVLWEKAWQVWIDQVMSGKSTLMKNPVLVKTNPRFTKMIEKMERKVNPWKFQSL